MLAAAAIALAPAATVQAQEGSDLSVSADLDEAGGALVPLFLVVTINGKDTNLVAEFALDPATGRMSAPRSELEELGLKPPRASASMVALSSFPGLSYRYDEASQAIHITVPATALEPEVISARSSEDVLEPDRSFGAVLNYSFEGAHHATAGLSGSSLSASFDGWVFSPIGTLRGTGVMHQQNGAAATRNAIRLETVYEVSSVSRRTTLALGDVQSGTLPWTRSIRMAGIQLRRDFSLRSDLVTQQLLSFDGAAAVPSTVDVFIDNNRTFSTPREVGRFRLEDLSAPAGPGEALIVVTEANGRKTTKAVRFYISPRMMKKGVADFSIEAGRAREAYGLESNRYGNDGVVSASLRYGLAETVTVEGNLQMKSDLRLWGLGLTTTPFMLAEVSLAGGASDYRGKRAAFAFGAVEARAASVNLSGSVRWSEDGFADLAYATGADYLGPAAVAGTASLLETPRLQTAVNLSTRLGGDATLGLGFVASDRASSRDKLVTASYGRDLPGLNGSLSVYGAHDLITGDTRAAVGLSIRLGKRKTMRSTATVDPGGAFSGGLHVNRAISDKSGDYGYALDFTRDRTNRLSLSGRGEYMGRLGKSAIEMRRSSGQTGLRVSLDGAVAIAGGSVALGPRIGDSFAIVDAGAPGVPITLHNRTVARTGPAGKALVPGLQAHRRNRVGVDLSGVSGGLALDATAMEVVPGSLSGVKISFAGDRSGTAVVALVDRAGRPVEAGATARLDGKGPAFFVGFDGETLVEGLGPDNRLVAEWDGGRCEARFAFKPATGEMQVISGVPCV